MLTYAGVCTLQGCAAAQVALGEVLHTLSILLLYIYINVLILLQLLPQHMCTHTTFFCFFFSKKNLQGCAAAQVALGEALRDGSCGAEKDLFKARSLFQLAAQQATKKECYVSSYYYVYVCTHVSSYYYIYLRSHMCPHTTAYVCVLICVLILVHICVLICVLIFVHIYVY